MSMISPVDSYYTHVVKQMATLQATVLIDGSQVPQPFGGVVNARDWPGSPPLEGALYLLFLDAVPSGLKSAAQAGYTYFCQWMWLLIGTDIQGMVQVQSRADRYRQNMQILKNLRDAHYPGWCQKMDYSANVQGIVASTPSVSAFPYVPPINAIEMVTWTPLKFMPKSDNEQSGLIFGAAAVELEAYDDISLAVA